MNDIETLVLQFNDYSQISVIPENSEITEKLYKNLLNLTFTNFLRAMSNFTLDEFIANAPTWEDFVNESNMNIYWTDKNNSFKIYKVVIPNPDCISEVNPYFGEILNDE